MNKVTQYFFEADRPVFTQTDVAVAIEGTDKLKKSDVESRVLLRQGFFARPSIMTKDAEAIRDLYAEKGYNRTTVETVTGPPDADHRAVVTYRVREGGKVKIRPEGSQITVWTIREAIRTETLF